MMTRMLLNLCLLSTTDINDQLIYDIYNDTMTNDKIQRLRVSKYALDVIRQNIDDVISTQRSGLLASNMFLFNIYK